MRIICFGDSLTSCGGAGGRYSDILQARFPTHEFINRGNGGETFADALERLEEDVICAEPDLVLVEYGANDWWRDERPFTAWADDLDTIVRRIRDNGADVVILGVFGPYRNAEGELVPKTYGIDARAASYRGLEAEIAAKYNCGYVPNIQERIIGDRCCWRDRNHPNEYGNRYVADMIEPLLTERVGTAPAPIRKPTLRTTRDMWREAVLLAPEKLAAVDGERRLSFREADDAATGLGHGLLAAAGRDRPKVAVFLPNGLEYFLLYWAVVKIGGVIIPLNTWLKEESLAAVFATVGADLLVVNGRADRGTARSAATAGVPVYAVNPEGCEGVRAYSDLSGPTTALPPVGLVPEDVSIIMHTSGTTAAPKGAVMRHSDLVFNVMTTINAQQFGPNDVHILVNPMFHCTALYSQLPVAAYQKTAVIITGDTAPEGLLGLIEKEGITTFMTVPAILQRIVALPELARFDVSSLRLIAYAGSPMPVGTIRKLQQCFPEVELHNFFGLTETTSATHVLSGEDAEERPDSIGKLLPFVSAMVVDDALREVAPGTVGELLFGRDNVIEGYYNLPGKLAESIVEIDGMEWFRTGDLAMVDEEGFFFIKGRQKDMIIVGGENVYAAEVEGVLFALPGVREAAVKGVTATGVRASLGELIKAYIVPDGPELSETDVRRHCHAKLPSFKIPHVIEFRESLPRNATGKVVKRELD